MAWGTVAVAAATATPDLESQRANDEDAIGALRGRWPVHARLT